MCSCSFGFGAACAPQRSVPELEVLGLGGEFIERGGARDARAASMVEEILEEDAAMGGELGVVGHDADSVARGGLREDLGEHAQHRRRERDPFIADGEARRPGGSPRQRSRELTA